MSTTTKKRPGPLRRVAAFYLEGFRNMTLGKTLWAIIALKLLLFFGVVKVLFFPNILAEHFDNDRARAGFVYESLKPKGEQP